MNIIISDIKMPGMDGFELLRRLKQFPENIEVILITGYGEMNTAIEGLREGAFDFLTKPIDLGELMVCLQRTRRYQEARREKDRLQQHLQALQRGEELSEKGEIIGTSQAIHNVLELVGKVSPSGRTTVLIQGESGTGKELVARAIHRQSPRATKPFVSINCTAIPENLLESELFGHEKGAFTDARHQRQGLFELADGGTLFLDEIGDMSLGAQAKILRALEEQQVRRVGGEQNISVDVRLISATHQDLDGLVKTGKFRQDLYYRLRVFIIPLPPLRQREDDVLLLAHHFLRQFAAEMGKEITGFESEVKKRLADYPFPGNIRELRNLIEGAVILCDGPSLGLQDFQGRLFETVEGGVELEGASLNLEEIEKRVIQTALLRAHGKLGEAARYLGIGDHTLRRRMKKYDLKG